MAQKSIHILNKNGNSMFWSAMWDDKINFTKSFKKQFFLQNFFNYLVEDYNSINFFKKNFFFFKKYTTINNFKKNFKFNKFFNQSFKNYNFNTQIFNSKIWVLKFQKWFIIFFFIYDSKNFNTIKNKNSNSIKFKEINYFNYFNKISKLNFNFEILLKYYNF